MKALVKSDAREVIWLEDVAELEMDINDILIKVRRTLNPNVLPSTLSLSGSFKRSLPSM